MVRRQEGEDGTAENGKLKRQTILAVLGNITSFSILKGELNRTIGL